MEKCFASAQRPFPMVHWWLLAHPSISTTWQPKKSFNSFTGFFVKKMCQILLWKVENITYKLRVFDGGNLKASIESPCEFLELLVGKFELANI
jgi:hypothetical protein